MPSCEDRTVVCDLSEIKQKEGLTLTDNTANNTRNNGSFGAKFTYGCEQDGKLVLWIPSFEVRCINFTTISRTLLLFLISIIGYVIAIKDEGYPAEWDVECFEPSGYKTQWRDQIWLNGRWKGLDAQTIECIDPLRCYNSPSPLPIDYTVEANLTNQKHMIVNTTIFYKCAKECKYLHALISNILLSFLFSFKNE